MGDHRTVQTPQSDLPGRSLVENADVADERRGEIRHRDGRARLVLEFFVTSEERSAVDASADHDAGDLHVDQHLDVVDNDSRHRRADHLLDRTVHTDAVVHGTGRDGRGLANAR